MGNRKKVRIARSTNDDFDEFPDRNLITARRSEVSEVNMSRLNLHLLWLGVFAILAACSGNMQGVVRGTGQPVLFAYQEGMSSDSLTTEIEGEEFTGKAVMRGSSTTIGTVFGDSSTSTLMGSRYTGDIVATLIGNRGSTLSCQLQYADSSGLTSAGGVGVCQHSDGRIIDMVW